MPRPTLLARTVLLLALMAVSLGAAGAAKLPYRANLPLVACNGFGCGDGSGTPNPPNPNLDQYTARMLQLINAQRATVGCPALTPNTALMRGAQAWSEKMVREGIYRHSGAGYYQTFGYPRGVVGENIGPGETPEYAFEGWMESAPHKRNLEWCYHPDNPSYDPTLVYDVGIGFAGAHWTFAIGVHLP